MPGTHGFEELHELDRVVEELESNHWLEAVVVHDEQTHHLGVFDESDSEVAATTLRYLQEQGFDIIHAGVKDGHGWIEARRYPPSEVYD